MPTWILQHFLNPAFFWPGVALLALPIIIHLINRLRFRRVRFAAMEFLLASQKRNRRRVLFEQWLLLLLRLIMIALIVALLGRFVVDPEELSLFQGARAHHVVIVDDSASMRDRLGETSAFDEAREVLRRILAEGARRPGTQMVSLILMSDPERTVAGLSERVVDEALLADVTEQLQTVDCSWEAVNPAKALDSARRRLMDERTSVRNIHVLSDFRTIDWIDNKGAIAALKELEQAGIGINLVRCVEEAHENLGLTDLGGAVEVAAAGVPVSLTATVSNWGSRQAENVQASLFVDGARLPRTINFQTVAAGESITRRFDLLFETAEPHSVRMTLPDDSLAADNVRALAVDVPVDHPVLIVDGSPGTEQARYVADALAADKSVTGFAPDVRTPEELRRVVLDQYGLIYLINVPQLSPDAVAALEDYVRQGGGLVWYLGDAVQPGFYSETLFDEDLGLFPVRLGPAPLNLVEANVSPLQRQLTSEHPLFEILTSSEVPILDQVLMNIVYPIGDSIGGERSIANDVTVVADVGERPVMFEHRYGRGRIFTALTSAGPLKNPQGLAWNNWASGPAGFSFVVLQLELAKRMIRKDRSFPQLATGTPIEVKFSQALFKPEIEITGPDDRVTRITASPTGSQDQPAGTAADEDESTNVNTPDASTVDDAPEGDATDLAPVSGEAELTVQATYHETGQPGIYRVLLTRQDEETVEQLYAMNVPAREGAMEIITEDEFLRELGPETAIRIQPAGAFDWIRSESPGSEVRWLVLVMLALFCLAEQLLASRMTHPE